MKLKEYIYKQMVWEGSRLMCDGEDIPSNDKLFEKVIDDNDVYVEIGRGNIDDMGEYAKSIDRKKLLEDIEKEASKPKKVVKTLRVETADDLFGNLFGG